MHGLILLTGISDFVSVPLVEVKLQSDLVIGTVNVGIVDKFPIFLVKESLFSWGMIWLVIK